MSELLAVADNIKNDYNRNYPDRLRSVGGLDLGGRTDYWAIKFKTG